MCNLKQGNSHFDFNFRSFRRSMGNAVAFGGTAFAGRRCDLFECNDHVSIGFFGLQCNSSFCIWIILTSGLARRPSGLARRSVRSFD